MFERISRLFGSKKLQPNEINKSPDPRFTHVNYGSLQLLQVNDSDTLNTLTDIEISRMINSWETQFANLDNRNDYLMAFFKDIKTLSKIKNADTSLLGPIKSIQYKELNSDESINTDIILTNANSNSDIHIKVNSNIKDENEKSTRDIEIKVQDKLVLNVSIYGDFERYTHVHHFVPGTWLSKFMPFLEKDFAKNISNVLEESKKSEITKRMESYRDWANKRTSDQIMVNNTYFPIPRMDDKKSEAELVKEYTNLENEWYECLVYMCDRSFENFDLLDIFRNINNPSVKTLVTNLNLRSIKTNGLENDIDIENPLSDSGIDLVYSIDLNSTYDDQSLKLSKNGKVLLSVESDYLNLILNDIKPGPWIETFNHLINEFTNIKGLVKNITQTGENLDNRTLAATMFEV